MLLPIVDNLFIVHLSYFIKFFNEAILVNSYKKKRTFVKDLFNRKRQQNVTEYFY